MDQKAEMKIEKRDKEKRLDELAAFVAAGFCVVPMTAVRFMTSNSDVLLCVHT